MTREEALEHITSLYTDKWLPVITEKEAFNMAIKALEHQDRIIHILDDYDLEAWEILEKIKEVLRV